MDLYGFCLALGGTGLAAMAVGGLGHLGHAGHGSHAGDGGHGHAGHAGHAHTGTHAGHDGHAHAAHGSHAHHAGEHGPSIFYSLLSPRVLFALLVGFGAGGLVAAPLGEPFRAGAAILAAAAFEGLLVGPLWRMLFRFESSPAATLESAIEDDARTVMDFDANGQGLVALDVDGQVVQLLATLTPDDRARGVRIRTGDVVRVSSIDAARNRCTVRLLDS
jgi:translation initiation factor IF-1